MKDFLKRLWRRAVGRRKVLPPSQNLPSVPVAKKTQVKPPPVVKKTQVKPPPVVRGERTLIVGVDFGTSSTKVIWQDLSDNKFEIFT